jgi:hypothetical protein
MPLSPIGLENPAFFSTGAGRRVTYNPIPNYISSPDTYVRPAGNQPSYLSATQLEGILGRLPRERVGAGGWASWPKGGAGGMTMPGFKAGTTAAKRELDLTLRALRGDARAAKLLARITRKRDIEQERLDIGEVSVDFATRGLTGREVKGEAPAPAFYQTHRTHERVREDVAAGLAQTLREIAARKGQARAGYEASMAELLGQQAQYQSTHGGTVSTRNWGPAGNPKANALWSAVSRAFPSTSFGGIYVNRNIAGTNTPSQHASGNALDIMVPNLSVGDRIMKWLQANRRRFGWTFVLWRRPDHYNHLHVSWGSYA